LSAGKVQDLPHAEFVKHETGDSVLQLTRSQVINHRDGGRGLYFEDPGGHLLEILTRPYCSGQLGVS
jgi:hypothetical protein